MAMTAAQKKLVAQNQGICENALKYVLEHSAQYNAAADGVTLSLAAFLAKHAPVSTHANGGTPTEVIVALQAGVAALT